MYNSLLDLTSRIIAHERVQAQVSELISEGTHAVLNDEEVMEHGKEFLTEGTLSFKQKAVVAKTDISECNSATLHVCDANVGNRVAQQQPFAIAAVRFNTVTME